jgi:hypothetical protein
VLRNTDLRAAVWEDLKRLRALPLLTRSPAGGQGVGGEGSPE